MRLQSDKDGMVRLRGLQLGNYGAWIVAPGYGGRWVSPLNARRKGDASPVSILMPRAGVLFLKPSEGMLDGVDRPYLAWRITDAAGHAVCPGGEVDGELLECGYAKLTEENVQGCRVDVIPPGRYTVEWEVHRVLEWDEPTSGPFCRGTSQFEIRKGEETVVALTK